MADRSNVERFAYIYDIVDEGVHKAIKKTDDAIDTFVTVTTKGLTTVFNLTQQTISGFLKFSSKKVLNSFKAVLFPIQEIRDGVSGARKAAKGLVEKMAQGAKSTFQFENRLSGIFGILKTIAKIGGLGVLLGPFIILIKPFLQLVSVITDTLQPALDTITETLKGAFAPVAAALHRLSLKLLPHLMRVIAPIVVFMVRAVEEIGKFFEEGHFEGMLGIFDELVPLIDEMIDSFIRDFLKPVGGVLFRTVIKLFQSLVKFAVEFVKTVAPYMPRFFNILQKVANLIITTLGDALDNLLLEMTKQLPNLVPLIIKMLNTFEAMIPHLEKLLPLFTELIVTVLAKVLTPAGIAILDAMLNLLLKILQHTEPLIDDMAFLLEQFNKWLSENSASVDEWSEGLKILGEIIVEWFKDAKVAAEELVRIVGEWIEDLKEVLKFLGLIEDKTAEQEKRDKAHWDAAQGDLAGLRKREELALQNAVKEFQRAGKSEAFIKAFESRRKAEIEFFLVQQAARIAARQEGGHIVKPELAVVGEAGPEWIVPDTPEGLMEYLPQMVRSVMKKGPMGAVGPAAVGAGANELLAEILEILKRIAEMMAENEGDEFGLPEVL
jgi:hypothetical protein